jgi:RNA polymerase sigma-70 factor (ECF subfamily)
VETGRLSLTTGKQEDGRREISDFELVQRSAKGDESAFEELVRKYQQKVYAIAYGISHSRQDALDISQEVFIKIYKKLKDFRGASSFYTWLYRITTNLSIDFQRRKKKVTKVDFDERIFEEPTPEARTGEETKFDPSRILESKEIHGAILKAIEMLPEDQKTTIVLRELENLSYREIAKAMNCSIGTVMSRLHYGRRKLQEMLSPLLS